MNTNNIDYYTMKIPFKNIRKVIKDIEATSKEIKRIARKNTKEQTSTEKEFFFKKKQNN